MLERLLLPENHAIAILIKDHDTVKDLFDRFEKSESAPEKQKIIKEALSELKIHAVIEEDIFYPAVRKYVEKDLMNEADEEHHVARVLIAELDYDNPANDHREAKFTVLAENVRHHIKEEEGEMLPKAKNAELDFEALGRKMLDRKKELKKLGIPPDAEHAMIAAVHGKDDTPAAAARRTRATPSDARSENKVRSVRKATQGKRSSKSGRATKPKRRAA
jgi:hypothetical protein